MKVPLKNLIAEFKAFAFKGNMVDLAVAVIIAAAFGAVVNSLVKNIFMPLVNLIVKAITGSDKPPVYQTEWTWQGIHFGLFIADVISFLIVAAAVFITIVKLIGYLTKRQKAPLVPTTRECPLCLSEVPIKASRCRFCTADLKPAA